MIVKMNVLVCDACGHHWLPKKGTKVLPYRCTKCKTTAWNKKARQPLNMPKDYKPTYHGIGRPPRCKLERGCLEFRHTVNHPQCLQYAAYAKKHEPPPPAPPRPEIPLGQPLYEAGRPLGEHHHDCPCIVCRGKRLNP